MLVLQFAFGDDSRNPYLPFNYDANTVVYTGTHDNDTTRGWYAGIEEPLRHRVRSFIHSDGHDIAWDLMRLAFSSVADWAITPIQDVLDLGGEARMNTPGRLGGNWAWRFDASALTPEITGRLADLTTLFGRAPRSSESEVEAEVETD